MKIPSSENNWTLDCLNCMIVETAAHIIEQIERKTKGSKGNKKIQKERKESSRKQKENKRK